MSSFDSIGKQAQVIRDVDRTMMKRFPIKLSNRRLPLAQYDLQHVDGLKGLASEAFEP